MISITARFQVRPEHAEQWPDISRSFTESTRAEPGCLWFDWARSLDDPCCYVLIEAFTGDEAGAAHVRSEHFARAQRELPGYLAETPRIIHVNDPALEGWSELGELAVQR